MAVQRDAVGDNQTEARNDWTVILPLLLLLLVVLLSPLLYDISQSL